MKGPNFSGLFCCFPAVPELFEAAFLSVAKPIGSPQNRPIA